MKYGFLTLCFFVLLFSCKKNNEGAITGEILQKAGCFPDSWAVLIDNPGLYGDRFLCDATPLSSITTCQHTVIISLPEDFAKAGKKIRFSFKKNLGIQCQSSTYAPNHIEVTNLAAR